MIKYLVFILLGFKLLPFSIAQTPSYWQQDVDYQIHVTLNDLEHSIAGDITIVYTNNSPDTLPQIWMHIWPNAYRNPQTALGRQLQEQGSFVMLKADKDDFGYMDSLLFTVDGKQVQWKLDDTNQDIGVITLAEPLLPGQNITISTPFFVKIPSSKFSRMGHSDQSYQITQWYPKPAVYDRKGWHAMPYLNQGEFYSEFGNFNVYITVPANYVIAASGDLQTNSELQFLNQKAIETSATTNFSDDLSFPPSDTAFKTLHYVLQNAHDFAWFADKRFHVLKGQIVLPFSQRSVTTWAYFTNFEAPLWAKSIDYINRSVLSYSDWVGEYPWNVAQAVEGALSAGAGMEYPTITIIGESGNDRSLDNVITHEVGHNWFYGILGSNERDHAWMDEGINSYYEDRYIVENYGQGLDLGLIGLEGVPGLKNISEKSLTQVVWILTAGLERMNKSQALDITSAEFGPLNYGLIVYMKTAYLMAYLADFLGQGQFDRVMAQYYKDWQFKHPYLEDLQEVLERETGESLNWFFDGLLMSERSLDYKVKEILVGKNTISVRIQNKKNIPAPFPISIMSGDSVIRTEWQRGFVGTQNIFIRIPQNANNTKVRIDANETMPDNMRENNTSKLKGIFRRVEPLQIKPFLNLDNPYHSTISFSPLIARNANDGFMLGLGIWNSTFPAPKFEYVFAPMYGFASKDIAGQGSIGLNLYPEKSAFNRARLSIFAAHYHIGPVIENEYFKLQPQLDLDIKPKTFTSPISQKLQLRTAFVRENILSTVNSGNNEIDYLLTDDNWYYTLQYALKRENLLFPFDMELQITSHADFINLSAEYEQKIRFAKYRRGLEYRLYAGYVSAIGAKDLDNRYQLTLAGTNGAYDYMYDNIYLARNTQGELFSNQIYQSNGFFKVPFYQPGITTSDNVLLAANIVAPIPKLPFAFFADAGLNTGNLIAGVSAFQYDAGIMMRIAENFLEIYFPLLTSSDLPDVYGGNYSQYISFMFNINNLNLFEHLRTLRFD